MSDRLTNNWTESLEEAFGPTGSKGREGELFALDVWSYWGYIVKDSGSQRLDQLSGIDIEIQKPTWKHFYSMDVKNNIDEKGGFYIDISDKGWLFNPKKISHRICHVNPSKMFMCWYDRQQMKNTLTSMMTNTKDVLHYVPQGYYSRIVNWRDLSSDKKFISYLKTINRNE